MSMAKALLVMPDPDVVTRFLAKCEAHIASTCVLFNGATSKGYGNVWAPGLTPSNFVKAHRLAWRMVRGPIPHGMTVDHLCETTTCVNPYHMELVPLLENVRRRHGPSRYS